MAWASPRRDGLDWIPIKSQNFPSGIDSSDYKTGHNGIDSTGIEHKSEMGSAGVMLLNDLVWWYRL